MNFDTLAFVALILAAIPCGLFLVNLLVYRSLRKPKSASSEPISVLIPARNEEKNIRATLTAVLAHRDADCEVIVLDDHSIDSTASIVAEFAARDARVRLESAPPLPAGWCGKQHACHVLAGLARHPLLVFIDADVRLAPDALARLGGFMSRSGIALASGVPRQELGTFSERLLLPLIHFVLLGFLPMHAMRRTRWPSMSAGCGQLFIARRDAYEKCGGHSRLRDSLHDGIKLPRVFRQAGFRTDLFDATDIATCRMYQTNADTWRGLGKNATEGLAAPGTIVPMTALLLGGQVVPLILCAFAPLLSTLGLTLAVVATALAFLPRLVAVALFRQSLGSALLHPLGVLALLAIQWHALVRHLLGRPAEWKGRRYGRIAHRNLAKAA
ncbi:MAG: glycosyltransferase [Verrucomicrobia bacterium]|nr:glycosyltransferase [Verrucomicrobiota bacterium]